MGELGGSSPGVEPRAEQGVPYPAGRHIRLNFPNTGIEMSNDQPLEEVLDKAIREAEGDQVTLDEILAVFGHRSFGPILMVLGLIAVMPPLGAVPGVPAVVGAVILLITLQIIFGRKHIWLPQSVRDRGYSKEKLAVANEKARPWLRKIDGIVTRRLPWLARGIFSYFAAIMISVLALSIIPLELIPFAVALPGLTIVVFGVAMVARDGMLMLLAYAISFGTIYFAWTNLPSD